MTGTNIAIITIGLFGCAVAFLMGAMFGRHVGYTQRLMEEEEDQIDRELDERDQRIGRGIRKESGRFEL